MYDFDTVINRRGTHCAKYDSNYLDDKDMIPMWVADMDFKTLPDITESLNEMVSTGIYGYGHVYKEYLESVVGWMKRRHSFEIKPSWIVLTSGVVSAIHLAIQAYTDENDAVMVMQPVYYPFMESVEHTHRKLIRFVLDLKNHQYVCDYEKFEETIINNDVRMLVFCNPHNPIGKVWTKEELYKIGMICKKHNVIIFSDEIHMDFVYEGTHIPFYNVDESFKDFTVIATAASKTFNLAGLQTSNIIISNRKLREQYLKILQTVGYFMPNILGMKATEIAYSKGDQWVDELLNYIHENIVYMEDFINTRIPELKVIHPEGLYLVWVDCRNLHMNPKELETFMLEDVHLWLDEGYIFGKSGEGFERFNVACPRSVLKTALERLEECIKNKKRTETL